MGITLTILAIITMLLGTFLVFLASVGLVRFRDVFCRMQVAGKAGTLGIALMIFAVVLHFTGTEFTFRVWLVSGIAIFFQFLTSPAATHLLARAAYITDYPVTDRTHVDELEDYLPSRPEDTYLP